MRLDLTLLKNQLDWFADEFKLMIIKEIGNLVDECSSVDDFKNRLDELCLKNIGKTSSQILMEIKVRLPEPKTSPEPQKTENSPLNNELVEVKKKITELDNRDKFQQAETKS